MRALLLALAAIAALGATDVPQVPFVILIYGIKEPGPGNRPVNAKCADVDVLDQTALRYWVTGYFSGANIDGRRAVGAGTTEAGLIADVKDTCRQTPGMPLSLAVKMTYEKMQRTAN